MFIFTFPNSIVHFYIVHGSLHCPIFANYNARHLLSYENQQRSRIWNKIVNENQIPKVDYLKIYLYFYNTILFTGILADILESFIFVILSLIDAY